MRIQKNAFLTIIIKITPSKVTSFLSMPKALPTALLYSNGKLPENIKVRCCDFKLLEKKCIEYNK